MYQKKFDIREGKDYKNYNNFTCDLLIAYNISTLLSILYLTPFFSMILYLFFKLFSYTDEILYTQKIRKHKKLCKKSHVAIRLRSLAEDNSGGV